MRSALVAAAVGMAFGAVAAEAATSAPEISIVTSCTNRSSVCQANFSFVYRGVEHRGIPPGWVRVVERRADADGARTYATTRATEPGTGLALVLVETRYRDLPVYEWEVSFENADSSDSGRWSS